jgi:hypothetical protein
MEELLTLIAAGSLIPAISIIIKKYIIDKVFEVSKNEITIKDKVGKEFKILIDAKDSDTEIKKIFETEIKFESEVQKILNKFIYNHKKLKLQLSSGNNLDFLLDFNDRIIGIEAKTHAEHFKAKWISNYFKENSEIDELIMIIDSKIPQSFLQEVSGFQKNQKVKFISSPRSKDLSKSINNLLEADLGINKIL